MAKAIVHIPSGTFVMAYRKSEQWVFEFDNQIFQTGIWDLIESRPPGFIDVTNNGYLKVKQVSTMLSLLWRPIYAFFYYNEEEFELVDNV